MGTGLSNPVCPSAKTASATIPSPVDNEKTVFSGRLISRRKIERIADPAPKAAAKTADAQKSAAKCENILAAGALKSTPEKSFVATKGYGNVSKYRLSISAAATAKSTVTAAGGHLNIDGKIADCFSLFRLPIFFTSVANRCSR
jgi:hypothetical protein